jgi:hypothetical protein
VSPTLSAKIPLESAPFARTEEPGTSETVTLPAGLVVPAALCAKMAWQYWPLVVIVPFTVTATGPVEPGFPRLPTTSLQLLAIGQK